MCHQGLERVPGECLATLRDGSLLTCYRACRAPPPYAGAGVSPPNAVATLLKSLCREARRGHWVRLCACVCRERPTPACKTLRSRPSRHRRSRRGCKGISPARTRRQMSATPSRCVSVPVRLQGHLGQTCAKKCTRFCCTTLGKLGVPTAAGVSSVRPQSVS